MHFDFFVEGLTRDQARQLMELIVRIVELLGLRVGGGWHEPESAE